MPHHQKERMPAWAGVSYDRPKDTDVKMLDDIHTALWITAQGFSASRASSLAAYTRRDPSVRSGPRRWQLLALLYDRAPVVSARPDAQLQIRRHDVGSGCPARGPVRVPDPRSTAGTASRCIKGDRLWPRGWKHVLHACVHCRRVLHAAAVWPVRVGTGPFPEPTS